MMDEIVVPLAYVNEVCKIGQGEECCRYLVVGMKGTECAKGTPFAAMIEERIRAGSYKSLGDNCEGYAVVQMRPFEEQFARRKDS